MRQEHLVPVLEDWQPTCLVWDGAPSHRGRQVVALAIPRIGLPTYSPELNPVERVFEEMRARTEGVVYDSLDAKQAEAERYRKELVDHPEQVKRLCTWAWIAAALNDVTPAAA